MLSITLITKNEAENLKRLLPVLQYQLNKANSIVSEILILDSKSSDGSKDVALSFGVKWHEAEFAGFGPQKKRAAELAKNDWVLNLDADEVPEDSFWKGIEGFFSRREHEKFMAARVSRDSVLLGRHLRYGGASEQKKIRLFNRKYFQWSGDVHEDVVPLTEQRRDIAEIDGTILHYSWKSIGSAVNTMNEYATRSALSRAPDDTPLFLVKANLASRFFLEFFRSYFLRLGILDGTPGFIFCYLMAFSHVLKYMKIYELKANSR